MISFDGTVDFHEDNDGEDYRGHSNNEHCSQNSNYRRPASIVWAPYVSGVAISAEIVFVCASGAASLALVDTSLFTFFVIVLLQTSIIRLADWHTIVRSWCVDGDGLEIFWDSKKERAFFGCRRASVADGATISAPDQFIIASITGGVGKNS